MHTIIVIDASTDLDMLREALAHSQSHRLRVTIEGDSVKFKINGGMWSHPMGYLDPECDAAQGIPAQEVDDNSLYRPEYADVPIDLTAPIVQDDKRAYFFRCENCESREGEKCSEPTNSSRKSVAYIHTARIEALRKFIDENS